MVERDDRPAAAIFRSPLFNASETFVQTHAASLRRYRPLVVGLEDKRNAWPELRERLLVATTGEAAVLKFLGVPGALARRIAPERPRLVHAHFATDGLLALPLAEALGVPLVTTLHGFDVTRSRRAMLASGRLSWMRYALRGEHLRRRGNLFIAVSDAIRAKALAQGFPPERTITHLNGVDLTRFARPSAPEPGLVLHVGRLVEKKGTALLLQAMAQLDAQLVVIGDGPLRPALERQAASTGGRTRFLGNLAPDEVAAWMARAWVLAVPSVTAPDGDSEGLPTVIAEAAAASLPVVVSDHSGLPEAVVEGETGFIVPEGDAAALARALKDLLAFPEVRGRMSAAARRLAEERFDAAKQAAGLEALYDRVTGCA
ncbi:MAG TPA: glycosyltransferase [Allosphingosinicella sp.]|nr:glycosyltransferase [Allosphingosinicella sp.]